MVSRLVKNTPARCLLFLAAWLLLYRVCTCLSQFHPHLHNPPLGSALCCPSSPIIQVHQAFSCPDSSNRPISSSRLVSYSGSPWLISASDLSMTVANSTMASWKAVVAILTISLIEHCTNILLITQQCLHGLLRCPTLLSSMVPGLQHGMSKRTGEYFWSISNI
jgi:hypothetical protein